GRAGSAAGRAGCRADRAGACTDHDTRIFWHRFPDDLGCRNLCTGEASMTFDDFKALVSLTFRDPATAARSLIAMNWPLSVRWMGLFLAVSVSALLAWLSSQLFPIPEAEDMPVL